MRRNVPIFRLVLVLAGLAAVLFTSTSKAQTIPQWIRDTNFISNRYLLLGEYWRGDRVGRFNVQILAGDPESQFDDFFGLFFKILEPNGSFPTINNIRPRGNNILIRIEDEDLTNPAYVDWFRGSFPGGVGVLGTLQSNFTEWRSFSRWVNAGAGIDLTFVHRSQLIRDLIREEITVTNNGGGLSRVGLMYNIWPDPTRFSFDGGIYLDLNRRVNINTFLVRGERPAEILFVDDVTQQPDNLYTAKAIVSGFDTTPPDEILVAGSSVNNVEDADWIGTGNVRNWDWPVLNPDQDIRSGITVLRHTWDPKPIAPGQTLRFIHYVGIGAASHGMSNAYVQAHRQDRPDSQGYISVVQTPPTLSLVNGFVAADFSVTAYMQNAYVGTLIGNATAVYQPTEAFEFSPNLPNQSTILPLGVLQPLNFGSDENSGRWLLRPTGLQAGILPVRINFNNSFGDAIEVVRLVHVPQGRRYKLTARFQMRTFPFTYQGAQNDPATVLDLPPGNFQILEYNPLSGRYDLAQQIVPGRGYWVRTLALGTIAQDIQAGATPIKLERQTVTTPLLNGWNLLGQPSPYCLPIRDLRFLLAGGELIGYQEAVARGLIRPTLFEYNPLTNVYIPKANDDLLTPGRAVWMFSRGERQVIWPAPPWHAMSITP